VTLANPDPKIAYVRAKSLIASAERHQVDPRRYLTSVLAKIGQTSTAELDQFLPDVWKREDLREPLPNIQTPNDCMGLFGENDSGGNASFPLVELETRLRNQPVMWRSVDTKLHIGEPSVRSPIEFDLVDKKIPRFEKPSVRVREKLCRRCILRPNRRTTSAPTFVG
jgi:hypothetical protein